MDQPTNPSRPAAPLDGTSSSREGRAPLSPRTHPSPARTWAGIWVIYLVWGSTYLGIAVAVESIPPFVMGAIRFALAGGILLAWTLLREGRAWRMPSRRELRDTAIVAALLLGGGMGLVAYGEQSVPSGLTALFIAMMPLWLAVFGRIFFDDRLPLMVVVGIAVGLVGVAILVWPGDASFDGVEPLHVLAVIVSPMLWSIGSLFAARRAELPGRPLVATGLQMALGSLVLLAMAVLAGEAAAFDPAAVTGRSMVALAYLTLVGSLLAFTVYAWLLRVAPLSKVATYAYVNPVVAVILGAVVLGEPVTPRTVLAGGVIVVAVALIVSARGRASRRAAAPEQGAASSERAAGRPVAEVTAEP